MHDCLLMGFELVWLFMNFEWKLENWGVLIKNEQYDDFDDNWRYDSMFVVDLIAFCCI